jgi:hypothetical protein
MKNTIQNFALILTSLFILIVFTGVVSASPQGPANFSVISSGRNSMSTSAPMVQAKAGNITAIVMDATRITQAWQGYYGNISGTIVLDDGFNFTMFDWSLPSPSGEVYSSNGSNVDWTKIYCLNTSGLRNQSGSRENDIFYNANSTQIELDFGVNNTDTDGLNETFNDTYIDPIGFRVGEITIDIEDGCSLSHTHTNQVDSNDWQELLLSDNESIIFTTIIRDNSDSYQPGSSDTTDFQMMVLEDGHLGSEDGTTPYYFYVELS